MKRRLILLGPSRQLVQLLREQGIEHELFTKPVQALDSVQKLLTDGERRPLLAYGELTFGAAVTGQAVRIAYDGPTVVLNDVSVNRGRIDTTLMYQAANRLLAWSVLTLDEPAHLQRLLDALNGLDVPRVTMKQRARHAPA